LLRVASNADGVLVGLYLAQLSRTDARIDASLAGLLSATAYAAEVAAAVPMGLAADAISTRGVTVFGALMSALGTRLFAATVNAPFFFASRLLTGMGVAAVTPPLLAFLAGATRDAPERRARAMSFFEVSLLAGLALGGVAAAQLWSRLHKSAFGAVALIAVGCAVLLFVSVRSSPSRERTFALSGLRQVLRDPHVRRLAPSWIAVNAVVGLWLGPTLAFLLTEPARSDQYLNGIFATRPATFGWVLFGYTLVFGAGVSIWSVVLPKVRLTRAMHVCLFAMLAVCLTLFAVNHSSALGSGGRAALLVVSACLVMVESGFTPAALMLLARSIDKTSSKAGVMGIYSMLVGVGAVAGSLLAAALAARWKVDGLLLGTVFIGGTALLLLRRLPEAPPGAAEEFR
jgi:MFS family permease